MFKKFFKSKDDDRLLELDVVEVMIGSENEKVIEKMKMIGLNERDLRIAKSFKEHIKEEIDVIVDDFYKKVLEVSGLKRIINENSSLERLGEKLRIHIIELFDGVIDDDFLLKRFKIAKIHYKIGLDPAWYMGSFPNLQNSIVDVIFDKIQNREEKKELIYAINKILSLEQQLVLEAYEEENHKKTKEHFELGRSEIKNVMREVSKDLVGLAKETQSSVVSFSENIKNVSSITDESNTQAEETKRLADEGKDMMNDLLKRMNIL